MPCTDYIVATTGFCKVLTRAEPQKSTENDRIDDGKAHTFWTIALFQRRFLKLPILWAYNELQSYRRDYSSARGPGVLGREINVTDSFFLQIENKIVVM